MPAPNAWIATFPNDVIYDTGILSHEVAAAQVPIGMTRGGNNFRREPEIRNPPFDGKRHEIATMNRIVGWGNTRYEGNLLQFPTAQATKLEPGSTQATAGTPAVTTTTPIAAGTVIALGFLMVKPRITWNRGSGGTFAVEFYYGLITRWELSSQDKDEGVMAYTILPQVDPAMSGYNTNIAPFKLLETAAA
jgi:hypothetical protein